MKSAISARSSATRQTRFGLWVLGARPQTLLLILSPMLVGIAYGWHATGRLAIAPVIAAMLSAIFIQIATNMANDAADGAKGADGKGRLGPLRLTGAGLVSATDMQSGALFSTLLALFFGAFAALSGGLPIVLLGIAAIIAAWSYSYGPWPIAMTPFGEVFVLAFFGIAAVLGMSWLASGHVDAIALALGLAIGLPASAVLLTNNHRDRVQDSASGRRTLAIVIGERWSSLAYAAMLALTCLLAAAVLWPVSQTGGCVALLLLVPAAVLAGIFMRTPISARLNRQLGLTALFQFALALAIAASLVMA